MDEREKKILTAIVLNEHCVGDIQELYDEGSLKELNATVELINTVYEKYREFVDEFDLHEFLLGQIEMLAEG